MEVRVGELRHRDSGSLGEPLSRGQAFPAAPGAAPQRSAKPARANRSVRGWKAPKSGPWCNWNVRKKERNGRTTDEHTRRTAPETEAEAPTILPLPRRAAVSFCG